MVRVVFYFASLEGGGSMEQAKGKGLSRRSFLRGVGGMIAFATIISATALDSVRSI